MVMSFGCVESVERRGGDMMRLEEFRKLYMEKVRRKDYVQKENEWHAKMLCYCRKRVLEEPYEIIADKDPVMIGQLVHIGVDNVVEYESVVYKKEIEDYIIYGTPDLFMNGELVEIKFTVYPPKQPREHDMMQLKIYMWLLGVDYGYLWYLSPFGSKEFEVEGGYEDEDIVKLIEEPRYPMWPWECKNCSLKSECEHMRW